MSAYFALLISFCLVVDDTLADDRVLVLSAASAGPAVSRIADEYERRTGIGISVSTASSGVLARQIQQGAPADIYLSASPGWMETLAAEGHVIRSSTTPLLRNRLVIISPTGTAPASMLDLSRPVDLLTRLSGRRLSIGDPAHVPAGQYAQQALENLNLWPAVRDRLARHVNVRAVLAFVERGESPLGIVYASDIVLSNGVRVSAIIPSDAHDPIVYGAAIVSGRDRPPVTAFFRALRSPWVQTLFEDAGFGIVQAERPDQDSNTFPSMP